MLFVFVCGYFNLHFQHDQYDQYDQYDPFLNNTGDFIVSCSNDRSIRLWERTDEQVFLEEERERELEESFESSLNRKSQGDHALGSLKDDKDGNVQQEGAPDTEEGESGSASTRSVANVRAGEVRRRYGLLSQCGMDVPGTHLPPTFSLCLSCASLVPLCVFSCALVVGGSVGVGVDGARPGGRVPRRGGGARRGRHQRAHAQSEHHDVG